MEKQQLDVLLVNSSAQQQASTTRRFASELITALQEQDGEMHIHERDVAMGIPFIDEQWVHANFTSEDEHTLEQKATLAYSDSLVDELIQADILVIAAPLYNFSVPASLKAWIDQISRVGRTFSYNSEGTTGILKNKKAYIVITTGGTKLGSDIDFASGYLRHVLEFIGITDVSYISAEGFMFDEESGVEKIRKQIANASEKDRCRTIGPVAHHH